MKSMTYRENVKLLLDTRKSYMEEARGQNRPEEIERLRDILIDTRDLLRELNDEASRAIDNIND